MPKGAECPSCGPLNRSRLPSTLGHRPRPRPRVGAFFSDAHPVVLDSPTTYSNSFTSLPLTADSFAAARDRLKARAGEPMALMPDLLVVPPWFHEFG